jgi:hypothetical protein
MVMSKRSQDYVRRGEPDFLIAVKNFGGTPLLILVAPEKLATPGAAG